MSNYISRQQAIDALKRKQDDGKGDLSRFYNTIIQHDIEAIMQLPSAQPELKKGKWIRDGHHIRCDQCGMYMCDTDREGDRIPTEFCPSCGAKMEDGEDETD